MIRDVTEKDLRQPQFKDSKVEDLEFRADGVIVRKDRWEMGIRRLQSLLFPGMREFEIEDIIKEVTSLMGQKDITKEEHY